MKSIAQETALAELGARLRGLTPETPRRWGTLTPAEMLCHLGDATDSVLGLRVPPGPTPAGRARPVLKWLMLYAPMPWPRGVRTRPGVDPRQGGTRPEDFERDRARVLRGLSELAAATSERLTPIHFMVGPMSRGDWQRWAYRHVDHHLRQFGL
ncbi:MAG TPA: DinB family protein [Gemmatimonadales bacterium]|nr:DinB family protein [Gemmatimonadales bacterium]